MYLRSVASPDSPARRTPQHPVQPRASQATNSALTGRSGTGLWGSLIALLAFPWAVHAIVVTLSAFGTHPLSGRLWPLVILVAAAALSLVASWLGTKRAKRAREERSD